MGVLVPRINPAGLPHPDLRQVRWPDTDRRVKRRSFAAGKRMIERIQNSHLGKHAKPRRALADQISTLRNDPQGLPPGGHRLSVTFVQFAVFVQKHHGDKPRLANTLMGPCRRGVNRVRCSFACVKVLIFDL